MGGKCRKLTSYVARKYRGFGAIAESCVRTMDCKSGPDWIFNQRVAGSNPAGLTNENKYLATVRVSNAGFSFVRGNAGVTSARSVPLRWKGNAGVGVADRYGSPRARNTEARDALTAAMDHLGDVDSAI